MIPVCVRLGPPPTLFGLLLTPVFNVLVRRIGVESGEVGLAPCLRPLAQTARAVFPQAAFLCGRHRGVEDGLMPGTR
jgi:hypothetical protein